MNIWRSRPNPPAPTAAQPAGTEGDPNAVPTLVNSAGVPIVSGAGGDGMPAATELQAGEMPFLDHLEELRWHIFKAMGGVLLAVVGCFIYAGWIIDNILLAQTHKEFFMYRILRLDAVDVVLQNRSITGQFFAYYGTVLAAALVVGSPFIVYQIWKFIEPGLYPAERKGVRFAAAFATFFFALGIAFGYLILAPFSLQYFANFVISSSIVNEFDISRYFSMLITWTFGSGLLFELPVVIFVLARIGVVTTELLTKSRRFALIIVLILAAIITPSTDPLSMMIMALPLLLLYEFSILLTRWVERSKRKEAAKAELAAAAAIATGAVAVAPAPGDVPAVTRPE